jgi:hypothetical protein
MHQVRQLPQAVIAVHAVPDMHRARCGDHGGAMPPDGLLSDSHDLPDQAVGVDDHTGDAPRDVGHPPPAPPGHTKVWATVHDHTGAVTR